MTTKYDKNSCNALEKPYYRPIEAAVRWCGLIAFEAQILKTMAARSIPEPGMFPEWPCLQVNTEKLFDAMNHGDIPHGRDGRPVSSDEHVAPSRRTIRHADLKEWMQKRFPDKKPEFLFGEIERKTHSAITIEAYQVLIAERDALSIRLEKKTEAYNILQQEHSDTIGERNSLRTMVSAPVSVRERRTFLAIIAAICRHLKFDYDATGAAMRIAEMTQELGASVHHNTIRDALKLIPDALESRQK